MTPAPTADDLARDAAADMALCEQYPPDECPWSPHTFGYKACHALPVWIRRAVAAEAEATRLRSVIRRAYDGDPDDLYAEGERLTDQVSGQSNNGHER